MNYQSRPERAKLLSEATLRQEEGAGCADRGDGGCMGEPCRACSARNELQNRGLIQRGDPNHYANWTSPSYPNGR